jgi:hypothetical protein
MTDEKNTEQYEGQQVDLYLFEKLQELTVKVEVLSNVQFALRTLVLGLHPEKIDDLKDAILGVAEVTERLWKDEIGRQRYRVELEQQLKLLDLYKR